MRNLFLFFVLVFAFTSCDDDCKQDALCTQVSANMTLTVDPCPDGKILICHKGDQICIDESSWTEHESHGDIQGECGTLSDDGLVFADGQVVEIDCKYELPFLHTDDNGIQWYYSEP